MSQRKVNIGVDFIGSLNELKTLYKEEKGVKVTQQETVELAITETLKRKKKK